MYGGIFGFLSESTPGISYCYNTGKIVASENRAGGIAGQIYAEANIEKNYNNGDVSGTEYVGGIIGYNRSTAEVKDCYNKGNVQGNTNIGTIIGEQGDENADLTNLFYLNTLGIGGINGTDNISKNIGGVDDDINNYQDFLGWIANPPVLSE